MRLQISICFLTSPCLGLHKSFIGDAGVGGIDVDDMFLMIITFVELTDVVNGRADVIVFVTDEAAVLAAVVVVLVVVAFVVTKTASEVRKRSTIDTVVHKRLQNKRLSLIFDGKQETSAGSKKLKLDAKQRLELRIDAFCNIRLGSSVKSYSATSSLSHTFNRRQVRFRVQLRHIA